MTPTGLPSCPSPALIPWSVSLRAYHTRWNAPLRSKPFVSLLPFIWDFPDLLLDVSKLNPSFHSHYTQSQSFCQPPPFPIPFSTESIETKEIQGSSFRIINKIMKDCWNIMSYPLEESSCNSLSVSFMIGLLMAWLFIVFKDSYESRTELQ